MNIRDYPVLFVDDEAENLITFRYAFEDHFRVLTARSGNEALALLQEHEVAVLLSDQRMPGMSGVELCEAARRTRPDTVRMIVTAYADLHAAIDAVNRGQVARYLLKPWQNDELADVIRTAIEFVHLQRAVQDMEVRLLRTGPGQVASAAKTSLIHEIKTPLHALVVTMEQSQGLVAQLASHLGAATDEHSKALLTELTAVHEDAALAVGQLRKVADRYRRNLKSPLVPRSDCGSVVDSTVRIVRRDVQRVAKLDVVIESSPEVAVDATILGQILLNLIVNAAQAIEEAAHRDASITIEVRRDDTHAVITVVDTGPGIADGVADRIFEPMFTTRSEGTGMGLAIARELAEQHGGQLLAHIVPDKRTCFELRLPAI